MSNKEGYSREGWLGTINHYDSKGHKIGESRPGFFGGYTNYDASGHKIGRSDPKFFGIGYDHYDNKGHKIGSSNESAFGGYNNYDAKGHYTGHTDRSVWDIDMESYRHTGSMYHKYYDPPLGTSYGENNSQQGNGSWEWSPSSGGFLLSLFGGLILTILVYQAAEDEMSGGAMIGLWIAFSILIAVVVNLVRAGFRDPPAAPPAPKQSAGQPVPDEWYDEIVDLLQSIKPVPQEKPEERESISRYIIARSPALGKNLYYRTDDAFSVGQTAIDTQTGERVQVLAAVECEKDALPPEAAAARSAVRRLQ